MEKGCSLGVHVSSSHENASSHMPAHLSVASCTNHVIPEVALSTISGLLTQNTVQFLKDMDDYFHCKNVGDSLKLP